MRSVCWLFVTISLVFCTVLTAGCSTQPSSPVSANISSPVQTHQSHEGSWKVYTSEKWGFSVQYPGDWKPQEIIFVSESNPKEILSEHLALNSPTQYKRVEIEIGKPQQSMDKAVDKFIQDQMNGWKNPVLIERSSMQVSGYPGTKIVLMKEGAGDSQIGPVYLVSTPDHFYMIWDATGNQTSQVDYKPIVDRIMRSFTILS